MKSLKSYLLKIAPKSWLNEYRDFRNKLFERKNITYGERIIILFPLLSIIKEYELKIFKKNQKLQHL